jgi:hypothetical protein
MSVLPFYMLLTGKAFYLSSSNMALNLAPFGRWTLRDKIAQRRLALLQGLPHKSQKNFQP